MSYQLRLFYKLLYCLFFPTNHFLDQYYNIVFFKWKSYAKNKGLGLTTSGTSTLCIKQNERSLKTFSTSGSTINKSTNDNFSFLIEFFKIILHLINQVFPFFFKQCIPFKFFSLLFPSQHKMIVFCYLSPFLLSCTDFFGQLHLTTNLLILLILFN